MSLVIFHLRYFLSFLVDFNVCNLLHCNLNHKLIDLMLSILKQKADHTTFCQVLLSILYFTEVFSTEHSVEINTSYHNECFLKKVSRSNKHEKC